LALRLIARQTFDFSASRCSKLWVGLFVAMVVVTFSSALSAESDVYDSVRLRHKPLPIDGLAEIAKQPSRFLTQPVEFSGRVAGMLRNKAMTTVILKLGSGETVSLLARPEHELVAVGETAQAVARLATLPGDCYEFTLLAMRPASAAEATVDPNQIYSELAQRQLAQTGGAGVVAPQPRYVLPSRGGPPPPSEERILDAYQRAIAYFNRRLDERQRVTIAKYIIDFSRRIGVDARLVMAVVAVESNFNPQATSHAGAMGLGQLMPATARGMGVGNAYDAKENLWAAIRIVRGHLERNDGDLALALACYNAGPGAVRRHGGVPPYRETQNYIRKVTAVYLQLAPEMAG
jgi:soluble lytic murein transglycosylase-like protein